MTYLDGSIIELPHTEKFEKEYGTYVNQHKTLRITVRVLMLCDVLNEMVIDGLLKKFGTGEREMRDDLILYERLSVFRYSVFMPLYFRRWGIQTRYDVLKNCLRLENFSGLSEIVIQQDFFITLIISNMEALLREEVNKEVKAKYIVRKYQVNISACVNLLRDKIIDLLLGQTPQNRLFDKNIYSKH